MTREATSVVLYRKRPYAEVFLVRRSPRLPFFGGYHAFPGGALEKGDGRGPVTGLPDATPGERARIFGASRELLEETGVLVADRSSAPLHPPRLEELRRASLDNRDGSSLAARLEELGVSIDGQAFQTVTRLVTPSISSFRFDTRFYMVHTDAEPRVLPGELVDGRWWPIEDALAAWRRGEILIAPPALVILERLATGPVEAAMTALRALPARYEGSGLAIPWTPGVEILPLRTPPLPSSLPTNTFLLGAERFVIIDPGPKGAPERRHLLGAIESRVSRGDRPLAIVLTHHHVDHIGALEETVRRFGLPVWAHPLTGEALELPLDRELPEGARVDLGVAPDGHRDWALRVVFTPGHAAGHIALLDEHYRTLVAGDLISTLVSMYVGSPGGHLRTYFASLRRVRDLPLKVLFPSHGPPTLDPVGLIDRGIEHRQERIEQIGGLLGDDPRRVEDIAHSVYREMPDNLRPLFERATRASLEYLAEAGRAIDRGDDRFSSAEPPTRREIDR